MPRDDLIADTWRECLVAALENFFGVEGLDLVENERFGLLPNFKKLNEPSLDVWFGDNTPGGKCSIVEGTVLGCESCDEDGISGLLWLLEPSESTRPGQLLLVTLLNVKELGFVRPLPYLA